MAKKYARAFSSQTAAADDRMITGLMTPVSLRSYVTCTANLPALLVSRRGRLPYRSDIATWHRTWPGVFPTTFTAPRAGSGAPPHTSTLAATFVVSPVTPAAGAIPTAYRPCACSSAVASEDSSTATRRLSACQTGSSVTVALVAVLV